MVSALVTAGINGGYLTSTRLAKVHWQAGDRPLPELAVTVAGESSLWVDPVEIPSDGDIGNIGTVHASRGDSTRVAVAKHLRLLEAAGMVVSRRSGRESCITSTRSRSGLHTTGSSVRISAGRS
jgi:hypothetical protein